ncbi:vomeronasal type-2 receptor 116-like [Ascaphus truei]|uniref:vomeronasal type-2 receptor 116-like n=1 Tax=Ascaphus truei TaxID=8439 RepID=UPI003F5ABE57
MECLRPPASTIVTIHREQHPELMPLEIVEFLLEAYGLAEYEGAIWKKNYNLYQKEGEDISAFIHRLQLVLETLLNRKLILASGMDEALRKQYLRGSSPTHPIANMLRSTLMEGSPPTFTGLLRKVKIHEAHALLHSPAKPKGPPVSKGKGSMEKKEESSAPPKGYKPKPSDRPPSPSKVRPERREVVCYNCGKKGHFSSNCPEKEDPPEEKPSDRGNSARSMVCRVQMAESDSEPPPGTEDAPSDSGPGDAASPREAYSQSQAVPTAYCDPKGMNITQDKVLRWKDLVDYQIQDSVVSIIRQAVDKRNQALLKHAPKDLVALLMREADKFEIDNCLLYQVIPRAMCTEPCTPGYRKTHPEGEPVCCYICVPCSKGEISNASDMEICTPCLEDQWPNEDRNRCIPKVTDFLSLEDVLGELLSFLSLLLSFLTVMVMMLFVRYRDTPIVKANNRDLSFVLLCSLMLSFLCSLLFIGRPMDVTCILRQTSFGIIFTVAVSSVLAKTVMVVIAFTATKPGSRLKKWVGPRIAHGIVIVSSFIQVMICVIWLTISAPFQDVNMNSEVGKIIIECNEGSLVAFYSVLGYMGLLAAVSFIVAFLARTLPDSFNEAKYITFSMLMFCSVWVSFIPAYLSTKGKYMVTVEIFAMLASGLGLFGCIFIPKCYVILLKPEQNTREYLMGRSNAKM